MEDREMINGFLASLSPESRRVFLRRYWFYDSIEEIGKRYGYSQSKVASMLFRTRKKMRDYLEKEGISV